MPNGEPLVLHRAGAGDRDRVRAVVRAAMESTLDVYDRRSIAESGLDAAANDATDDLLDSDPIECIRFAVDQAGSDVGLVSWRSLADGRGFVLQVCVVPESRGRGLAAQLVAAASAGLRDEGATRLIADTDVSNVAMVRAFARAGWRPTSTRHDLEPRRA